MKLTKHKPIHILLYITFTCSQSVNALLLPPCSETYSSKSLSFGYFLLPIKTTNKHNNSVNNNNNS